MHALGLRELKPDLKELSLNSFLEAILNQVGDEWSQKENGRAIKQSYIVSYLKKKPSVGQII